LCFTVGVFWSEIFNNIKDKKVMKKVDELIKKLKRGAEIVGGKLSEIKGIGPTKPIILTIGEFLEEIGEIPPIRHTKWSFIGSGGCGSAIVSDSYDKLKEHVVGFLCIDSFEDPLTLLRPEVEKYSVGKHHGFGGDLKRAEDFFKGFFKGESKENTEKKRSLLIR